MSDEVIGFAELDKAVIVPQTVIHLSTDAYDFIDRHTMRRGSDFDASWSATKTDFDFLSTSQPLASLVLPDPSKVGRTRLYLPRDKCRGKRFVLEDLLHEFSKNKWDVAKHRTNLKVALVELAEAVRAEKRLPLFDSDLTKL
jgi:hypothetical protein